MGKLKKNKDTIKTVNAEISKDSNKISFKPKKAVKTKNILNESHVLEKSVNKKGKLSSVVNIEQFKKGIEALLQYEEKNSSKDLFTHEKPMFLQIEAIKIPICPSRRIRIELKNTLLTDKQEVCLIVPDLKKGRNLDHEPTVEHYEELLRSKNVKSIKRILPIRQLRVEYDQFELKRRLCGYYDYFLVSGKISGHVLHLLGKTFIEKRKIPIPIKLDSGNLEENIENALKKATLHIHPQGSTFIVQFGHSEMSSDQLTENLKSVAVKLLSDFPGGWANIRALHIKTERSISIPIYYTLKSSNKVNVPVIKSIRPKKYEKITDEISTKESGTSEITVHPGGKVEFKKSKQTGISKNQLRKINQGRVHKVSVKLQAKRNKLNRKERRDKIRAHLKKSNFLPTREKIVKLEKEKRTKGKKQNTEATKQESQLETTKQLNEIKVEIKTENTTKKIKKEKIETKSEGTVVTPKKQKKKKAKKQNTIIKKENEQSAPKQVKEKEVKVAEQLKTHAKKQKKIKTNKENSQTQTLVKINQTETVKQKKAKKQKNKAVDEQNLKIRENTKKNKKSNKAKKDALKNIVNAV